MLNGVVQRHADAKDDRQLRPLRLSQRPCVAAGPWKWRRRFKPLDDLSNTEGESELLSAWRQPVRAPRSEGRRAA